MSVNKEKLFTSSNPSDYGKNIGKGILDSFTENNDSKPGLTGWISKKLNQWNASTEYVDAVTNLPPTYKTGEDIKFEQIICDTNTKEQVGHDLKRVDDAIKKREELDKKYNTR